MQYVTPVLIASYPVQALVGEAGANFGSCGPDGCNFDS
jgi:hypothetical protein